MEKMTGCILHKANKLYICSTENPGHDGLSHCLTKVDRASNPIDFYREPEYNQICPLFSCRTTFLVAKGRS